MPAKILIIDDDKHILELLKSRLRSEGYGVITAVDGELGMKAYDNEPPDLIIVDILMPNVDGYTFVRQLRSREKGKKTPVIVLTAKDRMKDLFDLEEIDAYFLKPYQPEVLVEKIRAILAKGSTQA